MKRFLAVLLSVCLIAPSGWAKIPCTETALVYLPTQALSLPFVSGLHSNILPKFSSLLRGHHPEYLNQKKSVHFSALGTRGAYSPEGEEYVDTAIRTAKDTGHYVIFGQIFGKWSVVNVGEAAVGKAYSEHIAALDKALPHHFSDIQIFMVTDPPGIAQPYLVDWDDGKETIWLHAGIGGRHEDGRPLGRFVYIQENLFDGLLGPGPVREGRDFLFRLLIEEEQAHARLLAYYAEDRTPFQEHYNDMGLHPFLLEACALLGNKQGPRIFPTDFLRAIEIMNAIEIVEVLYKLLELFFHHGLISHTVAASHEHSLFDLTGLLYDAVFSLPRGQRIRDNAMRLRARGFYRIALLEPDVHVPFLKYARKLLRTINPAIDSLILEASVLSYQTRHFPPAWRELRDSLLKALHFSPNNDQRKTIQALWHTLEAYTLDYLENGWEEKSLITAVLLPLDIHLGVAKYLSVRSKQYEKHRGALLQRALWHLEQAILRGHHDAVKDWLKVARALQTEVVTRTPRPPNANRRDLAMVHPAFLIVIGLFSNALLLSLPYVPRPLSLSLIHGILGTVLSMFSARFAFQRVSSPMRQAA